MQSISNVSEEHQVKKLKILIASSDNRINHGAFISEAYLAHELRAAGHECIVLLPYPNKQGEEFLDNLGIPHVLICSYGWVIKGQAVSEIVKLKTKELYNRFVAMPKIKQLLRAESFDIVHINTLHTYSAAEAAYALGVPVVWHFREMLESFQQGRIGIKDGGRRLIDKANRAIAVSQAVANYYSEWFSCKTDVVYNGVNPARFYKERDDLFSNNDSIRMVIVGAVYEMKGQLQLIEALAILASSGWRGFTLDIVGPSFSAEYTSKIEKLIHEARLEDRIHLVGATSHPCDYLHVADIAFVCSQAEAFGRTAVEAMMAGCAVVAANAAGMKEIISDRMTGFFYQSGSSSDLAETIAGIINNQEKACQIAKEGQAHAMSNFSAETNARQIESIYRDVLATS